MPAPTRSGHPAAASLSNKTPWGCEISVHERSLAPASLVLRHFSEGCLCCGRERELIERYVLDWMLYRINRLGEHPVRSCTRARVACETLGLQNLEEVLGRIDALYPLVR